MDSCTSACCRSDAACFIAISSSACNAFASGLFGACVRAAATLSVAFTSILSLCASVAWAKAEAYRCCRIREVSSSHFTLWQDGTSSRHSWRSSSASLKQARSIDSRARDWRVFREARSVSCALSCSVATLCRGKTPRTFRQASIACAVSPASTARVASFIGLFTFSSL